MKSVAITCLVSMATAQKGAYYDYYGEPVPMPVLYAVTPDEFLPENEYSYGATPPTDESMIYDSEGNLRPTLYNANSTEVIYNKNSTEMYNYYPSRPEYYYEDAYYYDSTDYPYYSSSEDSYYSYYGDKDEGYYTYYGDYVYYGGDYGYDNYYGYAPDWEADSNYKFGNGALALTIGASLAAIAMV